MIGEMRTQIDPPIPFHDRLPRQRIARDSSICRQMSSSQQSIFTVLAEIIEPICAFKVPS